MLQGIFYQECVLEHTRVCSFWPELLVPLTSQYSDLIKVNGEAGFI